MRKNMDVAFYVPQLSSDALDNLIDLARSRIIPKCRPLGLWIESLCERERRRRLAIEAGEIREADWPEIPIHQLSDSDVADGLHAVTVLSYILKDPAAGRLADKLVTLFVAAACSRLRRKANI